MKISEREKIVLWSILAIFLFLKVSLINYGLPYAFHPDESYIYKTPFKIALEYKAFNFSSTTNLVFWLLPVWYFLGFLLGMVTGHFHDWKSFEQALIIESPVVFFWGRLLSTLVSMAASYVLIRLWFRIAENRIIKWCGVLIILCNPVEWVSNQWIKFDPYCYFFLALLFYFSYEYFFEKRKDRRMLLYGLASLAITVRIDLAVLLVIFLAADLVLWEVPRSTLLKTLGVAIVIYALITFLPVVVLSGLFNQTVVEKTGTSFEEAITTKYTALLLSGKLAGTLWFNAKYYLLQIVGLIYLPYVIAFILPVTADDVKRRNRFYFSVFLGLLLPVFPFPYFAPHYFLLPAVVLTFLVLLRLDRMARARPVAAYVLSFFCILYFMSEVGQVLVWKNFHEDTRLQSREFLLERTTAEDVIGLEGYLNPGTYPPIDECSDVLTAKAEIVRRFSLGTGEGFRQRALFADSTDCRRVLEISSSLRFENKPGALEWVNGYDPVLLARQNPRYVASMVNYAALDPQTGYEKYMQTAFTLNRAFTERPWDTRVNILFDRENYFPSLFIYKSLAK